MRPCRRTTASTISRTSGSDVTSARKPLREPLSPPVKLTRSRNRASSL